MSLQDAYQQLEAGAIIPPNLSLADVTSERSDRRGIIHTVFDQSKAANAVIDAFHIRTTEDKVIWAYNDGVYVPEGENLIDRLLDAVAENLYSIQISKEVLKKIRVRTLCESTVFDSKPNWFGVANGIIDLETGSFLPYAPEHLITLKSPVKYDPAAKCPKFINFLWTSLGNIDDILTVIDVLVAMATTSTWEYFVAMIGPGSNGKSLLEGVISAFFGHDQVTEVELSELNSSQFIRGAIRRKRALINSEVQGTKMESRWIKMISGGTSIDSDQKNRDRIHFRPYCLQIFDTNNPPQFYDNSYGFQRRLIKLDFRYTFKDDPDPANPWERRRDPQLLEALTSESELSGILNLVILRAKDIVRTKTIHRRVVGTELVDEYDRQSHSMSAFFTDCFSTLPGDGWKVFTPFDEIKKYYDLYCKAINAAPESERALAFYIKKTLGCDPEREYIDTPNGRRQVRGYYGLVFEKDNFEDIVRHSSLYLCKTDNFSQDSNKTDNKTDNQQQGTLRQINPKYPVEVLRVIYSTIENNPENSVLSVLVSPVSDYVSYDVSPSVSSIRLNGHTYAEDGRDLDEDGDWEDCEFCGLPLPPSWQTKINGDIFCPDCAKIQQKRIRR